MLPRLTSTPRTKIALETIVESFWGAVKRRDNGRIVCVGGKGACAFTEKMLRKGMLVWMLEDGIGRAVMVVMREGKQEVQSPRRCRG